MSNLRHADFDVLDHFPIVSCRRVYSQLHLLSYDSAVMPQVFTTITLLISPATCHLGREVAMIASSWSSTPNSTFRTIQSPRSRAPKLGLLWQPTAVLRKSY